jgi:CheY-like chemotaxis protein/predicted regulator of Ras-like GTPase activity (Roadblock/LC7/MglB family)
MLRSSLELSGRAYEILSVGSAEEALREMEGGPVDLVVTDLRLPEMSGLELLARVRQTNPDLRAILVTGQPTRQVEAQARSLGVVAFIPKPISTTLFLQAVDRALRSEAGDLPQAEIVGEKARAAERLMTMRREVGASAALLVTLDGEVVLRAGDEDAEAVDRILAKAVGPLAESVRTSASEGADLPVNFLYLEGHPHRLFLTNVGDRQALVLAFPAAQEAWQMGAIFHYARRVVDDLALILPDLQPASPRQPAPEPPKPEVPLAFDEPPTTPRAVQRFWDDAADKASGQAPAQGDAMSYEQARKLGLIPDDSQG